MEFNATEVLGLVAAVCTTFGFVPQMYKTWKTKDVSSLSLPMYLVLCMGTILWLVYGLLINSTAVIIANIVALLFTFSLVVAIFKYRK
ncbi:SemiSWEET transporter [Aureisphaera galaxeae]|uniref:SemiSWEET family sugar transporter n=1 Tax=Aureisphaera galaxeae TaxID=1538023 RepID=UPI002350B4CC|nr:SemiSWEET transporter [Aureisphaera galaxeae]MDC8002777.1 SemiSWEET transporter [Aureisphaera galaxeae]